jgi:hypothetical protein
MSPIALSADGIGIGIWPLARASGSAVLGVSVAADGICAFPIGIDIPVE